MAAVLLLTGAFIPSRGIAADVADTQSGTDVEEITVVGDRMLAQIPPERELDQQGIESYGQSTVDELLGDVLSELGEDEQPLIMVNGERVDDISDIGGLPVEALKNVQILPRGSAVRVGGAPGQRVVNLNLQKQVRSATVLIAPKFATDGDWTAGRAEGTLTYVRGSTRANLTLKARDESDLLESDRDIIQPDPIHPYAIGGNVIGFPDTSGEIDPLLSAAAGEVVTVAPIPDVANPSLLDFVPNANDATVTDLGHFRTLRPDTRNYDLNGTFATRLAPWLTANIGLRFNHSTRRSLRGLPAALFTLAPTNASSPFSTTVALAEYGTDPLSTRSVHDGGDGSVSFNAHWGSWTGFLNGAHAQSKDVTKTERQGLTGTVPLPDTVDPFTDDVFDLVPVRTDRAESKTTTDKARLSLTGPLFTLPAGPAQATFEGQYIHNKQRSESEFNLVTQKRSFGRGETGLRAAIDLPITSSDGFGAAMGNLNLSGELSRVHYSDAGNVTNHELGISWEPRRLLRLEADLEQTSLPASVQLLGNPVIVTPEVRTFDPLTGDTVDVTQITGGNPDLNPEKTDVRRVSAIVRLVERLNLELNAEYTDTEEHNYVSYIPEASAAVMLAFPERFVRDLDGTLTTVDLRPVNFDSHREKRFRYGFSLNTKLGGGGPAAGISVPKAAEGADDEGSREESLSSKSAGRRNPATRLSLTATHSIVFKDEIVIRSGLPPVDLLEGGAIGLGGGRVRHQLDATASITSGGLGARVTASWRGKSTLNALDEGGPDRLVFSPVFNLGLRAFADLHRFLPHSDWARSMRLSINVVNATNDRQEVRDSTGDTPLRYQAGYRDPLGRTIEIELRKVF
ncbi:hypothetical protein [Sphingomonas alba]|uniref:TonB-dependent receptor n=1 Tax=Sphingomonas alba TaxID=2908208 RepID=A0ABT0RPX8_9SPHN|nr:hypothetical protein [Sphingomonas alba]MCL6684707.1 hypothetical protein [Sphingomonas alba]